VGGIGATWGCCRPRTGRPDRPARRRGTVRRSRHGFEGASRPTVPGALAGCSATSESWPDSSGLAIGAVVREKGGGPRVESAASSTELRTTELAQDSPGPATDWIPCGVPHPALFRKNHGEPRRHAAAPRTGPTNRTGAWPDVPGNVRGPVAPRQRGLAGPALVSEQRGRVGGPTDWSAAAKSGREPPGTQSIWLASQTPRPSEIFRRIGAISGLAEAPRAGDRR